jgi:hypothetical protein
VECPRPRQRIVAARPARQQPQARAGSSPARRAAKTSAAGSAAGRRRARSAPPPGAPASASSRCRRPRRSAAAGRQRRRRAAGRRSAWPGSGCWRRQALRLAPHHPIRMFRYRKSTIRSRRAGWTAGRAIRSSWR